jgi:hypothetical protein
VPVRPVRWLWFFRSPATLAILDLATVIPAVTPTMSSSTANGIAARAGLLGSQAAILVFHLAS